MKERHDFEIAWTLRGVDIADIDKQRQFAPEYAQLAYEHMRLQEVALGNFCTHKCLNVRGSQRKAQAILITSLNEYRNCKVATAYLAVSISDRYLKTLASLGISAPDLNLLGVTSLFIANKLEEHTIPNSV